MRQEGFRAVVLGATGLVGRDLVAQLLLDEKVESVTTIVRRASGREHSKLREHLVDFEDQSWTDLVQGDLLFSALGTTLRVAGSQSAQRRVDLDYQQWAAEAGARQGIKAYALVSSTGADERSSFFYPRMKGELDAKVQRLPIPRKLILRPSFLDGQRKEVRQGERLGLALFRHLPAWSSLAKIRPVKSSSVAQVAREQAIAALIELPDVSDQELARLSETRIIEAAEIFELVPPDEKKTP